MQTRDMTQGRPLRLILTAALPLMLGNVFQQMYTMVDASVVGKGVGVAALAALGSSDWFCWFFLSLAQGFAQGFSIPVAQAFGAHDDQELRRCVGGAILLGGATALALTAAAQASINGVLARLGTQPSVLPMSRTYLRILFLGLPVAMAYNLQAGFLRAVGDTRSPLSAMTLASLTNIALDVLFVLGFHWGVGGAAIATVISEGASACYCFVRLRKVRLFRLQPGDCALDADRSGRLLRLALPLSLQNGIIALGGMVVQSFVNPMGVAFIAGYTATNKLYGLLEIAAVSYGYAISTYAGQNLGAKKYERIGSGIRDGLLLGVATALAIAGAMFLLGRVIIGLFIDAKADSASLNYALQFLHIMSAFLPILYVLHVVRSALQGMGNTVMPMLSGGAELVMRVGSAMVLPGLIGHAGLFWAEVLAWIGADLILIPSYVASQRSLARPRKPAGSPDGA